VFINTRLIILQFHRSKTASAIDIDCCVLPPLGCDGNDGSPALLIKSIIFFSPPFYKIYTPACASTCFSELTLGVLRLAVPNLATDDCAAPFAFAATTASKSTTIVGDFVSVLLS
jgi:hypothetical protein